MSTIWTFEGIENNHDVCRGKDSMKKFCISLRELAIKIITFEKKKMMPLTNEEYESCLTQINCHVCKKRLNINTLMIKIIIKLNNHCHYTAKY